MLKWSISMGHNLPKSYSSRIDQVIFRDDVLEITYQPLIYEFAGYLASRANASRIVDIGCGSGRKLKPFAQTFDLVCLDFKASLEVAKSQLEHATFVEIDLETGLAG